MLIPRHSAHSRFRMRMLVVGVLLLVSLAATACSFEVQPIETYTTVDGFLTVTFPAAWDVIEDGSMEGVSGVILGNDPMMFDSDNIPDGASGGFVMLMPGPMLEEELGIAELDAETLLSLFIEEMAIDPSIEVGETESISLPGDVVVYRNAVEDTASVGYIYASTFAEDMHLLAMFGADDDVSEGFDAVTEQVLGSIRLSGSYDEYMEFTGEALEGK